MGGSSRRKGVRGEAEVRRLYAGHGFAIRGLEGEGDHLALGHGLTIFSESKRQEVWRLPLWLGQCWRECPPGAVPVLSFRSNRWPWTAALPLADLLAILARDGKEHTL